MTRSVFVGDLHGCAAELEELLDRVGFADGDRLYLVGDLVNRGPDARGVMALMRRTAARAVLGNHEEKLLALRHGRGRPNGAQRRLLAELDADAWALLEGLPRSLKVDAHGLVVVHAGVVPGVPLEAQPEHWLTHLRSIDRKGRPSSELGTQSWATRYSGPPHVVFGHNARLGVQLHPWATGLDSGCVYGGALTALVLQAGQVPPPAVERAELLVSVPARRVYYDPRKLSGR